jgi:GTPase
MPSIVAIVGRPNVGKSTLFNRLTQSREAIVEETPGVTRDRHYGKAEWNGLEFSLIDTGGYIKGSEDIFEFEIRKQVQIAIDESDALLFVVDVMDGVTDFDKDVANIIRRSKKKAFLIANKADNGERAGYAGDFYQLGLGEVFAVSAINGSGTGEFLDELVAALPKAEEEEKIEEDVPKIAIVGRPNVGKSSFINALLNEDRNIVTDVAGTTRDAINTRYKGFGHDFYLIDTAGIRKKSKVHEDLEFYSVMRSLRVIENADVCVLMLDATQGIEAQDMQIVKVIQSNKKGLMVLVNKWDLVEKDHKTSLEYEKIIKEKLRPFDDVHVVFISTINKQRIFKAVETAMEVYENRKRRIPTRKLNEFFQGVIEKYPPPALKGKFVKIKYITQLPTRIPQFAFFCNLPQYISESYKRYLENQMRIEYNFTGVHIDIIFRKK